MHNCGEFSGKTRLLNSLPQACVISRSARQPNQITRRHRCRLVHFHSFAKRPSDAVDHDIADIRVRRTTAATGHGTGLSGGIGQHSRGITSAGSYRSGESKGY